MIIFSEELLQKIIMYCQENDIAMAQLGNNHVTMFLFGPKDMTPNEASVIAAHVLLTGVLSGRFQEDNQQRAEREDESRTKEKVN